MDSGSARSQASRSDSAEAGSAHDEMGWRRVMLPVVVWLSLVGPMWQILVTSSIPLYLNNQQDLNYDVSVLYGFAGIAVLAGTLALPIYFISLRKRGASIALWIYYFSGFAFLGAVSIHQWQAGFAQKLAATTVLLVAYVVVQFIAYRWWNVRRAAWYFAVFAVGFVAVDAFEFATRRVELPEELETMAAGRTGALVAESERLPNFYHVVFDEYQTDVFDFTLDSELADALGGFVFFDDAVTMFGRTRMSLAVLFGGRSYDFKSSQLEFQRSAFNGRQSMLRQLIDKGYVTEAYLHDGLFTFDVPFQHVRYHRSPTGYGGADSDEVFRDLWIYANFPGFLASRLIEQDRFANFEAQNVLDVAAPIKSLHAFDYLLRRESRQPGTGRYVFAHLILPHFPNVLDSDCHYSLEGTKTRPEQQAGCANKLMVQLITTLERLGRLRNSVILFQSDHGSRYGLHDGRLRRLKGMKDYGNAWNTARSRPLLLFKLPGRDRSGSLVRNTAPASILDIFPTVGDALGLDIGEGEGVNLFDAEEVAAMSGRQRWYYFFKKETRAGWTDRMVRFRVEDEQVVRDGIEILANNPQF